MIEGKASCCSATFKGDNDRMTEAGNRFRGQERETSWGSSELGADVGMDRGEGDPSINTKNGSASKAKKVKTHFKGV